MTRLLLASLLFTTCTAPHAPDVTRTGEGRVTSGHLLRDREAPPAPRARKASRSRAPITRAGTLPHVLQRIRHCEGHDDYRAENPHSTASGAFQVIDGTWHLFGGYRHASHAPRRVQDAQALALYADRGTQPWNASRRCWA